LYCIIAKTPRTAGRRPTLRLGWVTRVNPDGTVRAHHAPLNLARTPKWSKQPRLYRSSDIAGWFGKNVMPNAAEVAAIKRKLQPSPGDLALL
jgi:hypothetical protein